jgi:hypothetical protein
MNMEIFILAGQSNMQGCGNFGNHPVLQDDKILCFKDGTWQKALEPLHDYKCKVWPDGGAGLAMCFGLRLLENKPDSTIGFIPCALSGSSLAQWQPGEELFENAVNKALTGLNKCSGKISGILWHQGEAESRDKERAETYYNRLENTINGFRKAFDRDLPVVVGELGYFVKSNADLPYSDVVNAALRKIASNIRHVGLVSVEGLTCNDRHDNTHFDTASLRILGLRYAQAYINLS